MAVQWLRLYLPMQGVWVPSLVRKLRSIPHALWPKKHKTQNRSNMVTNSKKTLKMVHIKKKKILRKKFIQPKHWIHSILNKMKMAFFTKTEQTVLSVV